MKQRDEKLAMKPYLERLQALLANRSLDELTSILLQLAKEATVNERAGFIEKIAAFTKQTVPHPRADKDEVQQSLDNIAALEEEILERVEAIENGEYFEQFEDWDHGSYDEEPDLVSDEQREAFAGCLREAGGYFQRDRLRPARKLYHRLFQLMDQVEKTSGIYASWGDRQALREARARYCRCVYETSAAEERVEKMVRAMKLDKTASEKPDDLSGGDYPMLQDVVDARTAEMPEWQAFLPVWRKALTENATERANLLLLETTVWLEQLAGVSRLARGWGAKEPRGYVWWLRQLEQEQRWQEMAPVCEEALRVLPSGNYRMTIASCLVKAGEQLHDQEMAVAGKREQFASTGTARELAAFVAAAAKQGLRDQALETALNLIAGVPESVWSKARSQKLRVLTLLMSGKLAQVWREHQTLPIVGWRDGIAGVIFGSVLYAAAGQSPSLRVVGKLFSRYADETEYSWPADAAVKGERLLLTEISFGLKQISLDEQERKTYQAWAEDLGQKRIESIVAQLQRGSYDKAAEVLGALAECRCACDDAAGAGRLLMTFCKEKFNRHTAFRAEVKKVIDHSPVLKRLNAI